MKNVFTLIILLVAILNLSGQCPIACSSLVNVSLNPTGLTTITPDMILEGDYSQCSDFNPEISIQEVQGGAVIPTSPQVGIDEVGKELLAVVTDINTGNSCWGNLNVESKSNIGGITSCDGLAAWGFVMNISVNDPNVIITTDGCDTNTGSVLEYVNCVAAQNSIPATSQYELQIKGPSDYLNGVSTFDQVILQRHILGVTALENNCLMVGADATNDGRITVFDMLMFRQLILAQIMSLPNSASWRFYNAKALEEFPPIQGVDTDLNFFQSEFPLTALEIIAVKVGDLNGSAIKK